MIVSIWQFLDSKMDIKQRLTTEADVLISDPETQLRTRPWCPVTPPQRHHSRYAQEEVYFRWRDWTGERHSLCRSGWVAGITVAAHNRHGRHFRHHRTGASDTGFRSIFVSMQYPISKCAQVTKPRLFTVNVQIDTLIVLQYTGRSQKGHARVH